MGLRARKGGIRPREEVSRMRESELRDLAADNARKLGEPCPHSLDKRTLVSLVMDQAKRLSARFGRQGE